MATEPVTTFDATGNQIAQTFVEIPTEVTNGRTIRQQADAAPQSNRNFLAIASPTNAQIAAQVRALTRQNNGIIRLLLNQLDGTD